MSENPNLSKVLFLSGRPFFTTKDKVSAPFWSIAHGADLRSIIRFHNSTDGASIDKEILVMFTDSSSDHNGMHISTQVSIICLFIQVNLDMLVALGCFPTQSWVNPSERIISILNLSLQNCSLEWVKMSDILGHSHKKRRYSLETRAVLLIFSLEFEISGVPVQRKHQNRERWWLLWEMLSYNGANASEAAQKIFTDEEDYHKCSSYFIVCWIVKIC